MGFMMVPELNPGDAYGRSYKRRYTSRSIIGSVRYAMHNGFKHMLVGE